MAMVVICEMIMSHSMLRFTLHIDSACLEVEIHENVSPLWTRIFRDLYYYLRKNMKEQINAHCDCYSIKDGKMHL